MESFEFRAAFHVCSWLRECHSFDRKTTELIQLFQYTTTRSLMIFSVYVRMNNIITRKIERLRALITLAVCTRPNFRRFVPLRFCVAKIWPGTRLYTVWILPVCRSMAAMLVLIVHIIAIASYFNNGQQRYTTKDDTERRHS